MKAKIADLPSGVGVNKISNGRTEFWRVRLGKRFTGGTVHTKHFSNLGDAREWIFGTAQKEKAQAGAIVELKDQAGQAAFHLTPAQLNEAAAAFKLCKESGLSLIGAVQFAIKHERPTGGAKLLQDAITALIESKRDEGRGVRHLQGMTWNLEKFAKTFPKSHVHEIQRQDVADWLKKQQVSAKTKANYLRDLGIFFNFAVAHNWVAMNPCQQITKPASTSGEISVLLPNEIGKLLGATPPEFIPGMAIKTFAGLRTSELLALDWKDIKEDEIIVPSVKAKTRQRRVVTISDNLATWLRPCRKIEGKVVPLEVRKWEHQKQRDISAARKLARLKAGPDVEAAWHRVVEDIEKRAGVQVPPNALRHGFGSYHFAKFKNENLTAAEMGNSPAMVFRHYRAVVARETAEQFWKLTPSKEANIVEFAA